MECGGKLRACTPDCSPAQGSKRLVCFTSCARLRLVGIREKHRYYVPEPWWRNGIRARLKIVFPYGIEGSSPSHGTSLRRSFSWLAASYSSATAGRRPEETMARLSAEAVRRRTLSFHVTIDYGLFFHRAKIPVEMRRASCCWRQSSPYSNAPVRPFSASSRRFRRAMADEFVA